MGFSVRQAADKHVATAQVATTGLVSLGYLQKINEKVRSRLRHRLVAYIWKTFVGFQTCGHWSTGWQVTSMLKQQWPVCAALCMLACCQVVSQMFMLFGKGEDKRELHWRQSACMLAAGVADHEELAWTSPFHFV